MHSDIYFMPLYRSGETICALLNKRKKNLISDGSPYSTRAFIMAKRFDNVLNDAKDMVLMKVLPPQLLMY